MNWQYTTISIQDDSIRTYRAPRAYGSPKMYVQSYVFAAGTVFLFNQPQHIASSILSPVTFIKENNPNFCFNPRVLLLYVHRISSLPCWPSKANSCKWDKIVQREMHSVMTSWGQIFDSNWFFQVALYLDVVHTRMQKPLKKGGKKVVSGGKRSVAANKHGKGGTATKKGK